MGYAKLAKKRNYLASRLLAEMTGKKNTGMRENGLLHLGLKTLRRLLESASTVDNLDGLKYLTALMPYAMPKVSDNKPLQALIGNNQDGTTNVFLQVNNYLDERKQALQAKLGQVDRVIMESTNNSNPVNVGENEVNNSENARGNEVENGDFSVPSPPITTTPNNPAIRALQHPDKNATTKQPKQPENGNLPG